MASAPHDIGQKEIRSALDRVLQSRRFSHAQRHQAFLRYIVETTLSGHAGDLKEYSIGIEVFQRRPSFDPKADAVVRVEASRLRARLAEYYSGEGASDPVRIEVPKGGYVPQFSRSEEPLAGQIAPPARRRSWIALTSLALLVTAVSLLLLYRRAPDLPPPRLVPVTSFPGQESHPSLSPDGKSIAFCWTGPDGGNVDIYVMLVTGGRPVRLTSDPLPDLSPAWSPDGSRIAFTRNGSVFLVAPFGAAEQRVPDVQTLATPEFCNSPSCTTAIAWTPDGAAILFTGRASPAEPYGIFEVNLQTGNRQRLTTPPSAWTDHSPSISPDGSTLAFFRSSTGSGSQLLVRNRKNGTDTVVSTGLSSTHGIAWMPGGGELVYSQIRSGISGLWRAAIGGRRPAVPEQIVGAEDARNPNVWRDPSSGVVRLAFARTHGNSEIWRIPVHFSGESVHGGRPEAVRTSTLADFYSSISPDGAKLAFSSNRGGAWQLWVSSRDGSNPVALTAAAENYLGTPRWSPDGSRIVFDPQVGNNRDVYLVDQQGGPLRRLTVEEGPDDRPSWSADGNWIYFSSARSGSRQLWKIAPSGGTPSVITRNGGFEALAAPDGRTIYYTRGRDESGLWSIPAHGGPETLFLPGVWSGAWSVTTRGIYSVEFHGDGKSGESNSVVLYDFGGRMVARISSIGNVQRRSPTLSASRDGTSLVWWQRISGGSDIAMIENFR